MNYEEKYKEMKKRVLTIGQGYVEGVDYTSPRSIAEYIDPELCETEDEKISKAIIAWLKSSRYVPNDQAEILNSWIDWIKKKCQNKSIEQDTEIRDLWVYIREWNEKFGRLPKDEDELVSCINYVMKRQKSSCSDEEEELTEFELMLASTISAWQISMKDSFGEGNYQLLKKDAKELLDLARKEIFKSLPKWKKITKIEQNYLVYGYLSNDEYYLSIKELIENLPKEE